MRTRALRATGWALALSGAALSLQSAFLPAKAVVAQVLLNRAFERGVEGGEALRPWRWADMVVAGRLSHERLGRRDVVLRGGAGQAMAFGPADIDTGNPRIRMLSAHRDTHFRWLRNVAEGDRLVLEDVGGARTIYEVTRMEVRRHDNFALPRNPARQLLILSTCYPFDGQQRGPLRYVVWAHKHEA